MPLKTHSTNELRKMHHHARARLVKRERNVVGLMCCSLTSWRKHSGRIVVKMTRVSAGTLDDDNLRGALKAVRDELAALIGRDDGYGSGVHWEYAQEKGPRGTHLVRVEVFAP